MKKIIFFFLFLAFICELHINLSGCAQVISPTGGARDSIPPVLLSANPKDGTTNFTGNRITLNFNEYVVIDQLRENLLVSPTPKNDPYVDFKLRTVTIKIRDTLEPNTTYTVNLGDAIRDLNENNPFKNFSYVFSTGNVIDSSEFSGKVEVAETGKIDTTLLVFLYKNLYDSAVRKEKPKYISKVNPKGEFHFKNLSPGTYNAYALLDADGSKTYNSKSELFAFADSPVVVNDHSKSINLYAYVEEKPVTPVVKATPNQEKKLKYTTRIPAENQSLLSDLVVEFNRPLKNFSASKIFITDTANVIDHNAMVNIDSTLKKVTISNKWVPGTDYRLVILKEIGGDSTGASLVKSDTIHFKAKNETDYGSIKVRIRNFDASKNPVLQIVSGNEVVNGYPLSSPTWSAPLMNPGDYEFRILYDENKNGVWDPGNFLQKKQPEKVIRIQQKISIKANWDNETDISL
ncbi:MAG: Ig-like domain-containing protein [Ginsengibacter sp.]